MNELKEGTKAYPRKCLRDGDGNGCTETASHDGDDIEGYEGELLFVFILIGNYCTTMNGEGDSFIRLFQP